MHIHEAPLFFIFYGFARAAVLPAPASLMEVNCSKCSLAGSIFRTSGIYAGHSSDLVNKSMNLLNHIKGYG